MEIKNIVEDVLGGAIWWGIVVVAPIIWVVLRKWLPKVAPILLYAVVGTAATLIIYVLLYIALTTPQSSEPVVVSIAEAAPIQDRVAEWLSAPSAGTVMPVPSPPKGERFRTNFIYGKHTVNLFISDDKPDFLVARIPDPLSEDQGSWWMDMTSSERNNVLFELQLEVGLETEIAFNVLEAQVGVTGSKIFIFHVDRYIPIDGGLSRPWFWHDVEAAARYLRVYRRTFDRYYERNKDGNR